MISVHRLALLAAIATALLLGLGGVVTSRDAGLVFADWPLSEGSVNPDGWLRDADKGSEHGHRILGAVVGLLTIALAVALRRREERRGVRVLGWVAVAAVCVQGLLGGLRVTEASTELALVHGCLGQAFFCLVVALACLTSKDGVAPAEEGGDATAAAVCGAAATFALYAQVVLGAQLRHVGGPLQSHVIGAALASAAVVWLATVVLFRHRDRPPLVRPALLLLALLALQLGLGFAAADVVRGQRPYAPTVAQSLVPTAHQSTGALMLATSLWLTLRAWRRRARLPAGAFA
jgi:cytochrome c oxidase assembly protein subunit 15